MIAWLLAQALGSAQAHKPEDVANRSVPYQVSGTVTSARGGEPIAHCRVTLSVAPEPGQELETPGRNPRFLHMNQYGFLLGRSLGASQDGRGSFRAGGEPGEERSTTTDAQGHFQLEVPHAGAWILAGSARGFRPGRYQQHHQFSTALVLSAQVSKIVAALVLQPQASVTGYVLDQAGDPVENGQVALEREQEPDRPAGAPAWVATAYTQTDDRGHYEFSGLQDGAYRVAVQAQPWYATHGYFVGGASGATAPADPSLDVVFPITWFPGSADEAQAETLQVAAGESLEADVTMQAVPALHLLIPSTGREQGQEPARGNQPIRVLPPEVTRETAAGRPFGGMVGQSMSVDRNGTWNIGGLSPGTYQVRLPSGGGSSSPAVEIGLSSGAPVLTGLDRAVPLVPLTITLPEAQDFALQSLMLTNTTTSLTYSDRQRFRRHEEPGDDPSAHAARTLDVPPGEYRVTAATAPGYLLKSLAATGASLKGSILQIDNGTPTLAVTLEHAGAIVRGVARDADKPVRGAMVLLVPAAYGSPGNQAEIRRAQTATDGSFTIASVPAGPYLLVAVADGWKSNWRDPVILASDLAKGIALDVPATGIVTESLQAFQP